MSFTKNTSILVTFVCFLSLPMVFNSCQQSAPSKKKSGSSNTETESFAEVDLNQKYCSSTFGASGKLQASMSPFAKQKVYVNLSEAGASQKAAASDRELLVLIYNSCLQRADDKSFSKSVSYGQKAISGIDAQAYRYTLPDSMSVQTLTQLAEADDCVKGVSHNRVQETASIQAQFSDSLKGDMKHLEAIEAAAGYEILYGSRGINKNSSARDVRIAVVDTGVDVDHNDLADNIWTFQLDGEQAVRKGFRAETYGDAIQDYNPVDLRGHGTHVAGLIAAVSNNGIGVVGTMPYRAQIMAISADSYDSQSQRYLMRTNDVLNGIRWAAARGADVINISSGSKTYGAAFDQGYLDVIIDVLQNAKVPIVTSAGNDTTGRRLLDGSSLSAIPAIYAAGNEGLISVGASVAESKSLAFFSIYSNRYVEVMAPGTQRGRVAGVDGLVSTYPDALSNNNGYISREGTSQSSALVSAAAGLVVGWIREKTGSVPYPCVVEGVIKESSESLPELTEFAQNGRHLNLRRLAELLQTKWP
ncbi:MAG: S8 family serine peptidase [Bdellovibrionales bacterium]|nr:S8 family serine peptidase [Bdellovibrionales bacterium]